MRSSPSFLVESRSGGDDEQVVEPSVLKDQMALFSVRRPERPQPDDGAEIAIRLKVGYKTVLLVVVVFDLVHLSLRELIHATWFEQLLGL
jgi:hypothetical protein